jgi:Mg2+ and Co2+ transporter CorA
MSYFRYAGQEIDQAFGEMHRDKMEQRDEGLYICIKDIQLTIDVNQHKNYSI